MTRSCCTTTASLFPFSLPPPLLASDSRHHLPCQTRITPHSPPLAIQTTATTTTRTTIDFQIRHPPPTFQIHPYNPKSQPTTHPPTISFHPSSTHKHNPSPPDAVLPPASWWQRKYARMVAAVTSETGRAHGGALSKGHTIGADVDSLHFGPGALRCGRRCRCKGWTYTVLLRR